MPLSPPISPPQSALGDDEKHTISVVKPLSLGPLTTTTGNEGIGLLVVLLASVGGRGGRLGRIGSGEKCVEPMVVVTTVGPEASSRRQ